VALALRAIQNYQDGGSRGALLVSDDVLSLAVEQPAVRAAFESGLLKLLHGGLAPAAAEHACRQLAVVGTAGAGAALVGLLARSRVGTAAATALDALREPAVDELLRQAFGKMSGAPRLAVIDLLGRRRDRKAVPLLVKALRTAVGLERAAMAAALGNIADRPAALALRREVLRAEGKLAVAWLDACLSCLEKLPEGSREQRDLREALGKKG